MPVAIDHVSTAAIAASNPLGSYPNVVVVDFGRERFNYCPISMRDLIQWTAYRLDCDGGNHRAASLLRAIAEQFYPMSEDQADWIIEDLEDQGRLISHDFEEVFPPAVDPRLLKLVDGFACCPETFEQHSMPALDRNEANFLDFAFPDVAVVRFGLRGIRIHCLDLIWWHYADNECREMAHQDEEAWLDVWEMSSDRHLTNERYRADIRMRANYGDHAVDGDRRPSHGGTTHPAEQDAILAELAGLI
jgi:hypothetical protein